MRWLLPSTATAHSVETQPSFLDENEEDLLRRELAERDIDPDLFFDDEPFEGRPE